MAPVETRSRRRAELGHLAEGVGHAGVLALVFELLPPAEQCVTVAVLSREWHAWAAQKRNDLRRRLALEVGWAEPRLFDAFGLPLWLLCESWPRLSELQRRNAVYRAARHGDAVGLRWAHSAGFDWDGKVCHMAARGGHLAVLQWLRVQLPP